MWKQCGLLIALTFLDTTLAVKVNTRSDGVIGGDKAAAKVAQYATSLTGGEGCSATDIDHIRAGFAEMITLVNAATPFDSESQPGCELFGNPNRIQNYTNLISQNFNRLARYGMLDGDGGVINSDIHIRCDDPIDVCQFGNRREGFHAAYNLGNEAHINFCRDYFKMDSLDSRVDKTAADQVDRDRLMEFYNRATIWVRMVMHIREVGKAIVERPIQAPPNSTREWLTVVSEGPMNTSVLAGVLNERPDTDTDKPDRAQSLKYAYGATRAKLLAVLSTQMPYDAASNAENYGLYAQAQYIIRKKGYYPNVPIMDFPNEATVLTNENLQDGERLKFAFFDMPDIFPRPEDIELEGQPISSSAMSFKKSLYAHMGLTILAMVYCFALSSFG